MLHHIQILSSYPDFLFPSSNGPVFLLAAAPAVMKTATTKQSSKVKKRMKEKQQVTRLNKQITINKHPPCHAASGAELHGRAAPIRTPCFGHVTALLSLCPALFVTGEVSKRKRPKKKKETKEKTVRGNEMAQRRTKMVMGGTSSCDTRRNGEG